jgi:predicted enzyme related to lactoylglutathione lyase
MFKKLRTVIYHVSDLEKAKKWYQSITEVKPYFDEAYYVGFDIGGCELGLDPDFTGIRKGNQSICYWSVKHIDKCVKELEKQGAEIVVDVKEVGGGIQVAVVNDPFGNSIGLIEEPKTD